MRRLFALTGAMLLTACATEVTTEPDQAVVADGEAQAVEPEEPASEDAGYTEDDIEFKLAIVAEGSSAYGDQDRIAVYASALDRAELACQQDREMIADMTVRAVQLVEEDGGTTTHLEMLNALAGAIPEEMRPADCAEMYAALITLMVSG